MDARPKLQNLLGWNVLGGSSMALDDCSLVIATYQRPRETTTLLTAISGLPDQPAEIVIVDGSEGTDTEAAVRRWSKDRGLSFALVYVRSPKGLTRQRNVGIDISRGQYVFFLDDDCLPLPGYFSSMRKVFVEDRSKQIGAVTGLIVNEMNKPVPRRWRIRLALGLVPRLPPRIYHPSGTSVPRNTIPSFSGVRSVDIVDGGASAFRREVFAEHRFSEFFYGYAQGEDLEMSLRVRRRWQVLWCGDAHVNHNHAPDGRPTSYRKAFMEVRNRYFIWKRHSADAKMVDRARFWLDILFLMIMDLAWFLARPTRPRVLAHGFGLASATLRCLFSPPSYTEPTPRRQYALQVDEAQS